jgi:riboflavin kinase/FMN adenylyltransferase
MQIYEGLDHWPSFCRPTAVAIGNFDGVHLGHQKILRFLILKAKQNRLKSLVLTFSPHPERVLGRRPISMIQTLSQRLAGIKAQDIQAVLITAFDRRFSTLSTFRFVQEIIVRHLQAQEVIIGEDFRFGRNRSGDVKDLQRLGRRFGFMVYPIPAVIHQEQVVSSSQIRLLLTEGKIEHANALLGRPYEIEGEVIQGAARGRTLGFPTTNTRTENEILPVGVFVTEAQISGKIYPSVTNIGSRPTFRENMLQVESYLFDFQGNAYRKKITLRFLKKLRAERKFRTLSALVKQIQKDIAAAHDFFSAAKRQ